MVNAKASVLYKKYRDTWELFNVTLFTRDGIITLHMGLKQFYEFDDIAQYVIKLAKNDNFKITHSDQFISDNGTVFTLYDIAMTNLEYPHCQSIYYYKF